MEVVTGNSGEVTMLPDFIELLNNKIMRLRKFDAVIRRHKFKAEKDEHQFFYSELLLFHPWRDEVEELFPHDPKKCGELYLRVKESIDEVKSRLFPHLTDVELGRTMVQNFEDDLNDIGAELDPEGEMAGERESMAELAEEYAGLDPGGLVEENSLQHGQAEGIPVFRAPPVLEMDQLVERTRVLVWEQRVALNVVIKYCRDVAMVRRNGQWKQVKPPFLTVIGGAGTGKSMLINIASLWVQKLLATPGDDVSSPYLIRAAPTGKTPI